MQRSSLALRAVRTCAVLALVPATLFAQRGMGAGGFGRGRGGGNISRSEGIDVTMPVNPINLMIEHRQDLALSDSQFKQVIVVKRSLDSANAPLMRRIDSVQHEMKGGNPIFSQPSAGRRDSLAAGRSVVNESLIGVRGNISDFRDKAFGLLSSDQRTKATDIEEKAIKAAEEAEQKANGRGKP